VEASWNKTRWFQLSLREIIAFELGNLELTGMLLRPRNYDATTRHVCCCSLGTEGSLDRRLHNGNALSSHSCWLAACRVYQCISCLQSLLHRTHTATLAVYGVPAPSIVWDKRKLTLPPHYLIAKWVFASLESCSCFAVCCFSQGLLEDFLPNWTRAMLLAWETLENLQAHVFHDRTLFAEERPLTFPPIYYQDCNT
jgi:hypothetical protein